MWRPLHPLQFLAASSTDVVAMSIRPPYRGGRGQPRRNFSDRPVTSRRDNLVTGDSHLRSVRDANLGFRRGDSGIATGSFANPARFPPPPSTFNPNPWRSPHFNQNQQLRPQLPHYGNRTQPFRRSRPFDQNQVPQRRPQQSRPLDYRNWEYAKTKPPPDIDRFIVLSYNILADYLAQNHRSKLYYHIPRYMLDWEWRKKNMFFELGLWSADIMCFQEVDRYQDLEEELKARGYNGNWKRRTGNPIDGCAVFWRSSRFKLLQEESIEFNKLGLRDNVAQICVLEFIRRNNAEKNTTPVMSSTNSNKVVVCNIHVLYNPKRGEIKLGQVRILLSRAHAVSKIWNDAPVVLCGDFNCVPKSPLYNFISEQKLDLSGLDRDKVSGQALAEILEQRRYNRSPGVQTTNSLAQAPSMLQGSEPDINLADSSSNMQKPYKQDINVKNVAIMNNSSQAQSIDNIDVLGEQCTSVDHEKHDGTQNDEGKEETEHSVSYSSMDEAVATLFAQADISEETTSTSFSERNPSAGQFSNSSNKVSLSKSSHAEQVHSDVEQVHSDVARAEYEEKVDSSSDLKFIFSKRNLDENSHSVIPLLEPYCETSLADAQEVPSPDISGNMRSVPISSMDIDCYSDPSQVSNSFASGSDERQEKLENLSHDEVDNFMTEDIAEDSSTFLSALLTDETLQSNFGQLKSEQSHGVEDDLSPDLDLEPLNVEKNKYDPSQWTPVEIETATGNADCTLLENPLELTSTYTEVEDSGENRDSNGEPLVTSYNRCFLGTVDYIWRSQGLETVKVLAPIPKHVMQQMTPGFPTKKWGSDHVALASELAFAKGVPDETNVQ